MTKWNFLHFFKIVISFSSLQTPYLAKFWSLSYGSKCFWPIRLQGSLKWNISRKKRGFNLIFCIHINIKVSYKLKLWMSPCMAKVPQVTNSKYVSNISKKSWEINLIFLHWDKHQSFSKANVMFYGDHS